MATFDSLTVLFDDLGTTFDDTGGDENVSITATTVARAAVVVTPDVVATSPNAAVTPATVARAVLIPTPHMGEIVGDDIIYLRASHDPSIIKVARRGTPKRGSHTPTLVRNAGHRPDLSRRASANQPYP